MVESKPEVQMFPTKISQHDPSGLGLPDACRPTAMFTYLSAADLCRNLEPCCPLPRFTFVLAPFFLRFHVHHSWLPAGHYVGGGSSHFQATSKATIRRVTVQPKDEESWKFIGKRWRCWIRNAVTYISLQAHTMIPSKKFIDSTDHWIWSKVHSSNFKKSCSSKWFVSCVALCLQTDGLRQRGCIPFGMLPFYLVTVDGVGSTGQPLQFTARLSKFRNYCFEWPYPPSEEENSTWLAHHRVNKNLRVRVFHESRF